MKIGIDLDDTIWKFHENFFKFYNNKFGTNYSLEDYYVYDMEKFLGKDREEIYQLFDEYESKKEFEYLPLLNNVKEVLKKINENHTIYFITARSIKTNKIVQKRLEKYFDFKADVVFMHDENWNKIEEKVDFCVREGIDIMIDDSYNNVKLCSEKNIFGILIDYPWNKNNEFNENIIRVNNWKEIIDFFSEFKKEHFLINDRVYGKEVIEEKVLIDLIKSPSIQRLKKISQFGFPEKYYHKKVFSRYEHSIGTLILLRRMGASMYEQIAGLLHDVSHTAFSHVVDFLLKRHSENYQDDIFSEFVLQSEIPKIMKNNGYDVNKILDIEKYSLLERDSPYLCADRLDYSFRELSLNNNFNYEYFNSLRNHKGRIVFNNLEIAKSFSFDYMSLNRNHWGGAEARMRYFMLSNVLRKCIDMGILKFEDLKTKGDMQIIEEILNRGDSEILKTFYLFENGIVVENHERGISLMKKFRYVDPEILVNDKVFSLTELDSDYFDFLEKEKENFEKGDKIRLVENENRN